MTSPSPITLGQQAAGYQTIANWLDFLLRHHPQLADSALRATIVEERDRATELAASRRAECEQYETLRSAQRDEAGAK